MPIRELLLHQNCRINSSDSPNNAIFLQFSPSIVTQHEIIRSMKLVLSHETALSHLRAHRERGRDAISPSRIRTLDDCACSLRQVEMFSLPFLVDNEQTLHVLVPSLAKKQKSKAHTCHVLTSDIPVGAFWKIGDAVYVASPELLFIEMATKLPFVDLVLLGLELCGTYTLHSGGQSGFEGCPTATSKKRLLSFVQRAKGMRGAAIAQNALRWVVDGSNSPMESCLMLYLCLPVRIGGYAFRLPDLNPTTELGKKAAPMLDYDSMRCDLHWVKERVAIEYDSSDKHLKPRERAQDARRANTLRYKDIDLITVTPYMIADHRQFDGVAKQLAKALGVRMDSRKLLYSKARRELRDQLFPWLSNRN